MKGKKEMEFSVVILAGGKGTRMGKVKKPLLHIENKPIIDWVLEGLGEIEPSQIILVSGQDNSPALIDYLGDRLQNMRFAYQPIDNGTAGAANAALPLVNRDLTLVLFGDDSALYTPETLGRFLYHHIDNHYFMSVMALKRDVVTDVGGLEIVDDEVVGVLTKGGHERAGITSSHTMCGCMAFYTPWLKKNIKKLKPSPLSGELTLPSLIYEAKRSKTRVGMYLLEDEREWSSVNTPDELNIAKRKMNSLIKDGKK